jgi:hypothetical protein
MLRHQVVSKLMSFQVGVDDVNVFKARSMVSPSTFGMIMHPSP